MTKAVDTRRLYRLEVDSTVWPTQWLSTRPMAELRQFISTRYSQYNSRIKPAPTVVSGRGIKYSGQLSSYYDPNTHTIVLARHQRNHIVAMHELVHALGKEDHDKSFVDLYCLILYNSGFPQWWVDELREKYRLPS